ncbi:hypothetical protein, partial [Coxiella-like endosymbiont of Rhipicephalus sanguineus]|uniref:hypothetical protein n=1 Tax=Coxiella-like endosymbiont of Rhipicephalus sanguineus TaxID=1955402 RepID=UPI002041779C
MMTTFHNRHCSFVSRLDIGTARLGICHCFSLPLSEYSFEHRPRCINLWSYRPSCGNFFSVSVKN